MRKGWLLDPSAKDIALWRGTSFGCLQEVEDVADLCGEEPNCMETAGIIVVSVDSPADAFNLEDWAKTQRDYFKKSTVSLKEYRNSEGQVIVSELLCGKCSTCIEKHRAWSSLVDDTVPRLAGDIEISEKTTRSVYYGCHMDNACALCE